MLEIRLGRVTLGTHYHIKILNLNNLVIFLVIDSSQVYYKFYNKRAPQTNLLYLSIASYGLAFAIGELYSLESSFIY